MARILIVDDDPVLRRALRDVLEAAGYDVTDAADGDAALRSYGERGADLVLVDLFMPKRDGLEVIQTLRAAIPRPLIVAMSGGGRIGQIEVLRAAAAFGAARTLRKPFEWRDLLATTRELLEGRGR
jgi:two-component system, chemotaxis family, chemotaxis protein CheY